MSEAIDLPKMIADIRALVRRQSIVDVRKLGWDRVRELRVAPADFEKLTAGLPPYEGTSLVSIRIVVDRYLKPGNVIPLDEKGNVIEMPRTTSAQHGDSGKTEP